MIKQLPSLIVDFLNKNINRPKVIFLIILKGQWYIQLIVKIVKLKNITTDQLASCRISQKFMKDSYMTKWTRTKLSFFLGNSTAFEKARMRPIVS